MFLLRYKMHEAIICKILKMFLSHYKTHEAIIFETSEMFLLHMTNVAIIFKILKNIYDKKLQKHMEP